jgi:hypothetical protein
MYLKKLTMLRNTISGLCLLISSKPDCPEVMLATTITGILFCPGDK